MPNKQLPAKLNSSISIVLPTYNNERTIKKCLDGIFMQNFPKNKFEVIIIDGGSTDRTLEICQNYNVKLLKNKFRVEEKGRVIGVKASKKEIVGFIDADNIILDKNFFKKIIFPFVDKNISAVDTLYFDYEDKDTLATKYCALLSGDDPYSIYLGLNDRLCFFNGKWTGMKHQEEDKGEYLKVKILKDNVPAMGSNGFFVRKKVFSKVKYDPFIHTDFVNEMVENGYDTFGKAKVGIKHDLINFMDFFKKKIRRIKRRKRKEIVLKHEHNVSFLEIVWYSILFLTFIVPVFDAFRGYFRKKDLVWFFHPLLCFGVCCVYFYGSIFYR